MTDLVTRLRRWTISTDAVLARDLMDGAADEIERLRLTDEERESIRDACLCMAAISEQQWPNDRTAAELRHSRKTLLRLLKRLG